MRFDLTAVARGGVAGAATVAIILSLSGCGGSSGDDASLAPYYGSLATAIDGLDQRVSVYADHIQTSDDPEFARSLGLYNSALQSFAHDTDVLKPPSPVREAHKQMVQASVDMADAMLQLSHSGAGTHPPNQTEINFAITQARAVNSWNAACHKLQDTATAKKIDTDLKCATALHQRETPGI